jgi:uncharacterized protein YbjQ (UPF0145 family)
VYKLVGFGFRQVIGVVVGGEAANAFDSVNQALNQHFTDHSKKLQAALRRANDRAWQALSIALAGDTFLDKIKLFFSADGDAKGIREQVRLFLQDKSIGYEGETDEFRKDCLAELNRAKEAGLLSAENIMQKEVALQAGNFQRYTDPIKMVTEAERVMEQIAVDLGSKYLKLAKLLKKRPSDGPPLLVSAFTYFFLH